MIETEAKYWSPGNERVEKALVRLGARKTFSGIMEDVYFAHPSRDFAKTDEALRLRKLEDGAELAYKGPRMRAEHGKAREEITARIDDALSLQRILERLGFKEAYVVRKKRTSYALDRLMVELDDVEGLGEFVELEVLTESPQRTEELLETARKELGLTRQEPRTYLEMVIQKLEAEGRNR